MVRETGIEIRQIVKVFSKYIENEFRTLDTNRSENPELCEQGLACRSEKYSRVSASLTSSHPTRRYRRLIIAYLWVSTFNALQRFLDRHKNFNRIRPALKWIGDRSATKIVVEDKNRGRILAYPIEGLDVSDKPTEPGWPLNTCTLSR